MNYNKKSIEDIEVAGKRVLCRCDFNVPTKEGKITSDKRIVAALPTIKYLIDNKAKVILCSHMGKPKGEWKPELSPYLSLLFFGALHSDAYIFPFLLCL